MVPTERDEGYMDYIYEVNMDQLREVYLNQLENVKSEDDKQLKQLLEIVNSGANFYKILVVVYEWETGLND